MSEIVSVTPGLQCCLLCGRVLTDRALHDRLEEPVLASIRAEHPEWASADGDCAPCVSVYRKLLEERMTRAQRMRARADGRRLWARMSSLFGRDKISVAANQPNA
ncbi:MAG: hypothetical protein H0T45_18125 [Pyrinomonadaceae bacterium]|nr:hypothetical protein [Pyrinomonadaceae bacterium]MDQ3133890.1 DUF5129 domain-containing protein [Acidobacteriota bacterium]